jgi:hypothetical protein
VLQACDFIEVNVCEPCLFSVTNAMYTWTAGHPVLLHYGGKVLRDNLALAEYNVQRGSTIFATDAAPESRTEGSPAATSDDTQSAVSKRRGDHSSTSYPKRQQRYAAGLLLGGSLDV